MERLPLFGSQRGFYRVFGEAETRIALIDPDIDQLTQFLDRAKLFRKLGVDVPVIYECCFNRNIILEEDLGDASLDKIVVRTDDRLALYKQVIDRLVGWQKLFDSRPDLAEDYNLPVYDIDFAFNESMLFVNRYLHTYLGKSCEVSAPLKPYMIDLADRAASIRKTLMHRDLQSQNILWHKDLPCFVDFQTAMLGPYTYDLASLVYDNYVDLSVDEQETLIEYFFENYPESDRNDFYPAALQRTLQAISAYAFLSREQGKQQYEQFIPKGLRHLELLTERFEWVREKVLERI